MTRFITVIFLLTILAACQYNAHIDSDNRVNDTILQASPTTNTDTQKDIRSVEKKISGFIQRLEHWYFLRDTTGELSTYDSISAVNDSLIHYLNDVCLNEPATLTSSLDSSGLHIVSSADGKLRFYSWNAWLGGTMEYYMDYAQFKDGRDLHFINLKDTSDEEDYGCIYTGMSKAVTKDGRTVYLVNEYAKISTRDRFEGISAWEIKDGALQPCAIFQSKSKVLTSIGCSFDAGSYFTSPGFPDSGKELPDIHFDSSETKLYIPIVVSGSSSDSITNKYLVYKFDGNRFVYLKSASKSR